MTHIAFIMDGNRRFAKKLLLQPHKGHEHGVKTVDMVLEWCVQHEMSEVTLYAFSLQNLNRPKHEFNYLMDLFKKVFFDPDYLDKLLRADFKTTFIGRLDIFSKEIQEGCALLEEKTAHCTQRKLNICFGYGGREELVDAVFSLATRVKEGTLLPEQIDEGCISSQLGVQSSPDLIIRTGGEFRTSNFLPWQSVYSEWFFLEKKWPELVQEDLDTVLAQFQKRERRFGA